jgi:hypothetical protein
MSLDDSLFSDLEGVGMEALEKAVHRFDPTRSVSLAHSCANEWPGRWMTGSGTKNAVCDGRSGGESPGEKRAIAAKRHRTSTGGYRERTYTETAVQPIRRPDGISAIAI